LNFLLFSNTLTNSKYKTPFYLSKKKKYKTPSIKLNYSLVVRIF